MARDIRTLISSELHEPKYISDSTSSDAGKVITPLSGGDAELRYLTPDEVGINFYYLEWTVEENTTAIALTAATDSELYTGSDYTQIDSLNLAGATVGEQFGITFDSTDYEIEVPVDGVYEVYFWTNFQSDTATTKVGFKLFANGAATGTTAKRTLANSGTDGHLSATALSNLTAGTLLGVGIAADKGANIIIEDFKAGISLIREA